MSFFCSRIITDATAFQFYCFSLHTCHWRFNFPSLVLISFPFPAFRTPEQAPAQQKRSGVLPAAQTACLFRDCVCHIGFSLRFKRSGKVHGGDGSFRISYFISEAVAGARQSCAVVLCGSLHRWGCTRTFAGIWGGSCWASSSLLFCAIYKFGKMLYWADLRFNLPILRSMFFSD